MELGLLVPLDVIGYSLASNESFEIHSPSITYPSRSSNKLLLTGSCYSCHVLQFGSTLLRLRLIGGSVRSSDMMVSPLRFSQFISAKINMNICLRFLISFLNTSEVLQPSNLLDL